MKNEQPDYDFLIVGSGLYGSVLAHELKKKGQKCLIIDKRDHIGGNIYTEDKDGIQIHKYGAHIFHTNDEGIWNYVNQFASFNQFNHRLKVNYKDDIYSFPINLFTLYQMYGCKTPTEAENLLQSLRKDIKDPGNLEEWILSQVGEKIYEIFIKGYTAKQWQRDPKLLPSFIIKRLPIRLNFNDSYFNDRYQGIPIGGYTQIIEKMVDGIDVKLNVDYFADRDFWDKQAKYIIYTGRIDEFYGFKLGELEYRTLDFETERLEIPDFQGAAVVNYTEQEVPYTRILEHKHFEFGQQPYTYITKEYPAVWTKDKIPYYPINDNTNTQIFNQYLELAERETNVFFGGRLGNYRYYDMHQVIGAALADFKNKIIKIIS
jgi:UDP-galactopyranose mutase